MRLLLFCAALGADADSVGDMSKQQCNFEVKIQSCTSKARSHTPETHFFFFLDKLLCSQHQAVAKQPQKRLWHIGRLYLDTLHSFLDDVVKIISVEDDGTLRTHVTQAGPLKKIGRQLKPLSSLDIAETPQNLWFPIITSWYLQSGYWGNSCVHHLFFQCV